ncbi:hypothetical protein D3C78_1681870 [compost metagenome]
MTAVLRGADGNGQRHAAEDERQGRHHDRAQTFFCRGHRGIVGRHAGFPVQYRKFENQDGVFGGQRHQHGQADLEIDVVAQAPKQDGEQGAEQGKGYGQ